MKTTKLLVLTFTAKASLHLGILIALSIVMLYLLFYLHAIGINSILIPDQLRIKNGTRSDYFGIWLISSSVISYVEWYILLRGIHMFNLWFGREWLDASQMWIAKFATIIVGTITAIYIAYFYISLY